MGLIAFSEGGIADYFYNSMELDDKYDTWAIVDEINLLLNKDIFREYTYEDTFWWQAGNMLDDFADVIEVHDLSGSHFYNLD